jgi:hypothetical protein
MSNFSILLDRFKKRFPNQYQSKIDIIEKFVTDYIEKRNINVKFLNTIFHEIRHEQQMRDIKMRNPLTDFDLSDFEELYQQYWEMELDADQFAKNMVAKLIIKLNIPLEIAKKYFSLSPYVEKYPTLSNMIRSSVYQIIEDIKRIKKSGGEYTDIQDHPIVKRHIDKLEDFI